MTNRVFTKSKESDADFWEWSPEKEVHAARVMQYIMPSEKPSISKEAEGWREAAIAWSVCASLHERFAKGRDALYTTRQADYQKHLKNAQDKYEELK